MAVHAEANVSADTQLGRFSIADGCADNKNEAPSKGAQVVANVFRQLERLALDFGGDPSEDAPVGSANKTRLSAPLS